MAAIVQDGIQIIIKSTTGAIITIVSDTDDTGNILELEMNVLKNGGLDKFSFSLAKNTDTPITINVICFFYYNGTLWDSGYVVNIPEPDQDNPIFKVEGHGWMHRLKEKFIDATYTLTAFSTIVASFLSTYLTTDLGVSYDAGKIDLPVTIPSFTIYFTNHSVFDCIMDFINICNKNYDTTQYRFWIDAELELNIGLIEDTIDKVLFEGYDYQSPEVEVDRSKIVNKVLAYRTNSVTPGDLQLFATYEDTVSQDKYGIVEKKYVYPGALTGTGIFENMAKALLNKYKEPIERIIIKDVEVINDVPFFFKLYGISNKRDKYWFLVGEYNSLINWDQTNKGVTTVITSDITHTFTHRRCIRFTTTTGSNGTYIEYTLERFILFPTTVRIFNEFVNTPISITVGFIDINDVMFEVELKQIVGWTKTIGHINEQIDDDDLFVNYDVATEAELNLNYDLSTEGFMEVGVLINDGVATIKAIRVTMNSDTAMSMYLDRIEIESESYKYHELIPEEIKYLLSAQLGIADISFGDTEDSLIDQIEEKVEDGDLALAIYARN